MTRTPARSCAGGRGSIIAAVLSLGALTAAPTAAARSITDNWPLLSSERDGDCTLEIVGNGKFMVINATGLAPGASAHFGLTNATMKPIDWTIRANAKGSWQLIFLPLMWGTADGTVRPYAKSGTVRANLAGQRCQVAASAPWTREIRVIP